jgi:hypothetical protein
MSGFLFPILCLNEDLTLCAAVATVAVNALSFDKSDVLNDELFSLLRPRIFSARISKPVLVADIAVVHFWESRAVVSLGHRGGTSSEGDCRSC